jgi:hypothetical protein
LSTAVIVIPTVFPPASFMVESMPDGILTLPKTVFTVNEDSLETRASAGISRV